MMQRIIPHLWFDKEAEEAADFYASIFGNAKIGAKTYYSGAGKEVHGQDGGTLMTVDFELEGQRFIALNGGPLFKFNPSISFMVRCESAAEVDALYAKLSEGGGVLMPLDKYPFSEKYAWISDKYGLSWQLSVAPTTGQKIVPTLMYVGAQNGKAEEAMKLYTSVFPESKIGDVSRYGEAQAPNTPGSVMFAPFWLFGEEFAAMDSALEHNFTFNEAVSLLVECNDQAELDDYWHKLSVVAEAEQCGWLKDKYGVSWQIVPGGMEKYLTDPDQAKVERAMTAFLKMKKIDIAEIEKAFNA